MLQGRAEELDKCNSLFERKESNVILLYGNEYAGISSLWHEFAKEKEYIYLSAQSATPGMQTYLWAQSLALQIDLNAERLYEALFEAILAISSNENKKLLVIDHLESLSDKDDCFIEQLHSFIQKHISENAVTVVLLCSNVQYISTVFAKTAHDKQIGIAGYIHVKPLQFVDLVCSLNTTDFDEILSVYAILGGYEDALSSFTMGLSLKQNIIGSFLLPGAVFRHYGLDIIKEQLREPSVYASILASLAEGRNKLNELYNHLGFSRAKISVYLKQLCQMQLVEKVRSYDTPGAENTKKGVYRITNPMVKFYYTFIYPNESALNLANSFGRGVITEEDFYNTFIKDEIERYCMNAFPTICEEFLNLANDREYLPIQFIRYGEWVGKTGTVHMIAQDKERNFLFGFCNLHKGPLKLEEYHRFLQISKETHLSYDYLYLFSLDGFEDAVLDEIDDAPNIYLVDRSDLQ